MDKADRTLLSNWGMGAETLDAIDAIIRTGKGRMILAAEAYLKRVRKAKGDAEASIIALGSASGVLQAEVERITGHNDWTR